MVKLKSLNELKKNIRIVGFFFLIIFSIITVRAYFLQVLTAGELSKMIQKQHKSKIGLKPRRGTIYDRNGRELAVSIEVKSLFAKPHLIKDPKSVAGSLAPIIKMPRSEIIKKLTAAKSFIWIKRKITPSQAEKIESLKVDGLGFEKETQRFYPNKELAGQVIGFAGVDTQGLEGLELEYESILRGKPGELLVDRDAMGRHLFIDGINTTGSIQGHDIVLTIDKNIQYIAEKELQAAVSLSKAKKGTAIVMDPWTGEILAMAMAPLFNPNRFSKSTPDIWRNKAVTDVFEPGSTFKPFLVAAALEERLVKPRDIFFCENGSYRIARRTVHDLHKYGWLSVTKILKFSSNIGACKISKFLGKEPFYQYIRKFGFGEETGVQVPIEAAGFVPRPYRLSEHTQSAIAFGQGISVTPLQLAAAYCAVANGGVLMRPYFVKKIMDSKGMTVQENAPLLRRRVISESTALVLKDMLKTVISEGGTGEKAAVPGFSVAGKTGTSQKIVDRQEGYSPNKVVASFAGFSPADSRPCITVLVIIDEPQRMAYGGAIAAPVFSRISQHVMNYLHVVPDKPSQKKNKKWRQT